MDNTKDYKFYFEQGNDFLNQKRYEEALENYAKALVLNPEEPEIYKNIGNV